MKPGYFFVFFFKNNSELTLLIMITMSETYETHDTNTAAVVKAIISFQVFGISGMNADGFRVLQVIMICQD